MGMFRRFAIHEGFNYIKIRHKVYRDFHAIGSIGEIRDDLNIAKITFTDTNGKIKSYWFHLFTGNVVNLPKKKGNWATDVPNDSEKAYMLSIEPVYPYDLDPTLDKNYKKNLKKAENEEIDNESQPNITITRLE